MSVLNDEALQIIYDIYLIYLAGGHPMVSSGDEVK